MTHTRDYIKAFSLPLIVYVVIGSIILYAKIFVVDKLILGGIAIDLVLTAPLFYFFAAWRYKIRMMFVFPLIALGFTIGHFLIPGEHSVLNLLRTLLLPIVEIASVSSISYYTYRFYGEIKNNKHDDVYSILKKSTSKVLGRSMVSAVFATEFAVIWYGLLAWRRKGPVTNCTCYRDNSSLILYGFVVFILLAETLAFHFIFLKINFIFAWAMFALSLYFALQIFAHAKAMYLRSTTVDD
jgi:hypothetical protein